MIVSPGGRVLLVLVGLSACGGAATESERHTVESPDGAGGFDAGGSSGFDAGVRRNSCASNQGAVGVNPRLWSSAFSVGDVDGDGRGELVAVTGGECCVTKMPFATELFRNTTGRAFAPSRVLHAESEYHAALPSARGGAAVVDLNGDGLADITTASPSLNELAIRNPAQTAWTRRDD
jgi:hypothetical protein